jgi:hypothetical protein
MNECVHCKEVDVMMCGDTAIVRDPDNNMVINIIPVRSPHIGTRIEMIRLASKLIRGSIYHSVEHGTSM